jgi:hypothetical protein
MGLAGGDKIRFDAKVELKARPVEPTAAAHGQRRRFGYLYQPEHLAVEPAGERFAAGRDGHLHVIESAQHFVSPCQGLAVARSDGAIH